MKEVSVKKIFILAAVALVVLFGALLSLLYPVHTQADVLRADSDAVQIDYKYKVPDTLGLSETREGVRLRSSVSGSGVSFTEPLSGTFVLDFRVISQNAYSGSMDAALGSTYTNNQLELNQMSLSFTETKSGDSFSVIFQAGAVRLRNLLWSIDFHGRKEADTRFARCYVYRRAKCFGAFCRI